MTDEQIMHGYTENKKRWYEIRGTYSHVSTPSIYSTMLKICVKHYVEYCNAMSAKSKSFTVIVSGGNESFAVVENGKFVANESYVQKCIKTAHKTDGKTLIVIEGFMYMNIVLDELIIALDNRK